MNHRRHHIGTVAGRKGAPIRDDGALIQHRAVRQHRPLGTAGRAGGKDHRGNLFRRIVLHRLGIRRVIEQDTGHVGKMRRGQRRRPEVRMFRRGLGLADAEHGETRPGIFENHLELPFRQTGIGQYRPGIERHDGMEIAETRDAVFDHQRHAVARPDPGLDQDIAGRLDAGENIAVGPQTVAKPDGGRIRRFRRPSARDIEQSARQRGQGVRLKPVNRWVRHVFRNRIAVRGRSV